jgi:hypothetical protein
MREFWLASGHVLGRPTAEGRLAVTDDLLRAWLARPEIAPPEDACPAERALHARLRAAPAAPVRQADVAAMADPDARENWDLFLAFRNRLLAAGTVEDAYLDIVRTGTRVAPILLEQLVHLIMRNALRSADDPFILRAGEMFWRPQRASLRDGALVLADADRVEALERAAHASPLTAMFGPPPTDAFELMAEANAHAYWTQSDAHALALPFGAEPRARAGLAAAIGGFLRHLLALEVEIEPLVTADEPDLRWYVGLDAEGTRIGDALWRGSREGSDRLIGLFRLRAREPGSFEPRMEGQAVYLFMGMTEGGGVRLKPQNLIIGLPLAENAEGVPCREST